VLYIFDFEFAVFHADLACCNWFSGCNVDILSRIRQVDFSEKEFLMKKLKQFRAESHVVDGRTVRFQEIPFKVRDYSFRNDKDGNPIPHPDERARYEGLFG
jgi:hypothetical protein